MLPLDKLASEAAVGVLDSALASWRESRTNELGAFIARYPAGPVFRAPRGSEATLVAWTEGWTRGPQAVRSALAKALPEIFPPMTHRYAKALLRFVRGQEADPRLGDALAMLASAYRDRPMVQKEWRLAFVHHADQRHVPHLEALQSGATRAEAATVSQLIARLRATPPLTKATTSALRKLQFGVEQRRVAVADELFAAVYAAPKDVSLRAVLADALVEAGDPRGSFISEQLAGRTRAPASAELLASLLGPLEAALEPSSVEFRDGFPVSGSLRAKLSTPHQQTLLRRREWSTFETLWGLARLSPTLLSLQRTDTLPGRALMEWARQKWRLPLVSFGVSLEDLELVASLPTAPTALHIALIMDDVEYDERLLPLVKCSSLEKLTFGLPYASVNPDWPEWPAQLPALLPQLREVRWKLEGGEVGVLSKKARFDTLEVVAESEDVVVDVTSFDGIGARTKVVRGPFAASAVKGLRGFRVVAEA